MQFLPSAPNSHGYVPAPSILSMWQERFNYLYNEFSAEERIQGTATGKGNFLFPLVLHPDTSGMAHIIGMIDRMISWLKAQGEEGEVEFCRYEDVAREFKEAQKI